MKNIITFLFFAIICTGYSFNANASHFAGGEIWYEYVGTPQHPNRYDVYLIVYRDISGVSMCPGYCPAPICITSSCFGTITVNAPLLPFNLKPGSDTLPGSYPGSIKTPELLDCVNPNAQGLVFTEAYRFYTQVDLPGKCADIRFAYSQNARNGSDNMTTSGNFTIFADLNSILGPNTSPKFVNPAAKSFCAGTPFIWSQAAVEPDGDSLFYEFGIPQAGSCTSPAPMVFAQGYSKNQPMSTLTGINFNNRTGTLRFTASQQEVVVINIKVTEYRLTSLGWVINGSSVRDLQVPVVSSANCNTSAYNGPQFSAGSFPSQAISSDSLLNAFQVSRISNSDSFPDPNNPGSFLVNLPVIDYSCFDSIVHVKFDDGIYCETVAPDGTDFRIIGPDKVPRPVIGVLDNCRKDLVTKNIDLLLHKPLDVNGDYLLQIKKGSDDNTLVNKCGFALDGFFAVIIRVNNCPIPDYNLTNVSVHLDKDIDINWEIDPNSFEPKVFTSWNILRANENDQYYIIKELNNTVDVNVRSYRDTSLDPFDVDHSRFQYRVQLVQNGTHLAPSNRIYSILLKDTVLPTNDGATYSWTEYDGWADGAYDLVYSEYDPSQNNFVTWNSVNANGAAQNYFEQDYYWPQCTPNNDTDKLYAFRVICSDVLNPGNSFTSESNWLYYKLECGRPPATPELYVKVPNVFSPNNDGQNDFFSLHSAGYTNAYVTVFNRWGKPVFEASKPIDQLAWDGKDKSSGSQVADGVYYYVVSVTGDVPDGLGGTKQVSDELTGSLTIFSNGTK